MILIMSCIFHNSSDMFAAKEHFEEHSRTKYWFIGQAIACCLFGARPLPEPMIPYCQLDPQEQIPVKFG